VKKGKKKTIWWVIHERSKHEAPPKSYPSPYIEVLARRSLAEVKLEKALLRRGIKFIAQKRIRLNGRFFVVDFLIENKLIIECEGRVHQERLWEDSERQKQLEGLGYLVMRFADLEIFDHISICIDKVQKFLNT